MAAIAVSSDGTYIFLALEDSGGNQVIAKAARATLSTWSTAYAPGAGSAGGVATVPADPDEMLFYGNFGSGVQVVRHTISSGANTNISPAGLTTKVVNGLAVNPSDPDEMVITVDTDQDLKRTVDGGTAWANLNAALGFNATALWLLWSGAYEPHRAFVAGDAGAALQLLYTPNAGAALADYAGATLGAAAGICGVEVSEVIA